MRKIASGFNYTVLEKSLYNLDAYHSSADLNRIKNELNKLFKEAKCLSVIYTENTDKMFFGMRVYIDIDGNSVIDYLGDSPSKPFAKYYLEIDSKLLDPMLNLTDRELMAILLHEIGHIVYDTGSVDAVRVAIDKYFAERDEHFDLNSSRTYRELLAFAIKDSVVKAGSLFAKIGNEEILADTFVVSCGYGQDLESAIRKISSSSIYLNDSIDNRFIVLSWVLKIKTDMNISRVPTLKALNTAKKLTASELERRELEKATRNLSTLKDPIDEGFTDDIKSRFSARVDKFKINGIRGISQDTFVDRVALKSTTDADDVMLIVKRCNTNIAILTDYLSEDLSPSNRAEAERVLKDLYALRQECLDKSNTNIKGMIMVHYND